MIAGVQLSPLKIIANPLGDVLHGLKASENSFAGFGEAYFSSVKVHAIKGWKKHSRMTLNLVVVTGEIRFVIYDDRIGSVTAGKFYEVHLSREKYSRLTVPPGVWMAFQGVSTNENILMNLASIEHDPLEASSRALEEISYAW